MNSYEVNLKVLIETKILVGAERAKEARAHVMQLLADDSLLSTGEDRVVEDMIHKQCRMIHADENLELMETGQTPFGYYKQTFTLNNDLGHQVIRKSHYPSTSCVSYAVPARERLEDALGALMKLCDVSGAEATVAHSINNLKKFLEETVGSK